MSRYAPRNDPFARHTREAYAPDPEYVCAVCGGDVFWREEDYGWDEHGRICHAACIEEDGHGS